MPSGIGGPPESPDTITAYARRFLQEAADRGVQVLGITPHSPRISTRDQTSAVWQIVEEWNNGTDDQGVAFRERIYAVFPGFEPSLKDGPSGLHLLFMFDPEIGRENFLKAFDLITGGVSPWPDEPQNQLRMSNRSAEQAFQELRSFHERECPAAQDGSFQWNYIVLAPYIESERGLLRAKKAQVLQLFQHNEVAGLELADHKLPDETIVSRSWLPEGMATHHQSFFHSSDAYSVAEIGKRYTWIKVASPRIEALRQAFIASDSRMRVAYERADDGDLIEILNHPDVTMHKRPWLKSVTVSGAASFFGASGAGSAGARFDLSPDLTCIIGGSMTGKSTFLDGLRIYTEAPLPQDKSAKAEVEARGKNRFLAGAAQIEFRCPGRDTTETRREQWPAEFYTQTELQRLAQNPDAVEGILARLVASETQDIAARESRMADLDKELTRAAGRLAELEADFADAEQALQRSQTATSELAAFADAGVENLNHVSSNLSRWRKSAEAVAELADTVDRILDSAATLDFPDLDDDLAEALAVEAVESHKTFSARLSRVRDLLKSVKDELGGASVAILPLTGALQARESAVREQVDRNLAARGLDGARINQLRALNARASLLGSCQANLSQASSTRAAAQASFEELRTERQDLVDRQRSAFDHVVVRIHEQFDGRIMARRIDGGRTDPLDRFIENLRQRGVTRWWRDLADEQRPSPDELVKQLSANRLARVGMSAAVQETFVANVPKSTMRELAALRCRDQYVLEFQMDDGNYRPIDSLSGGQRVNLLLSLLLDTNDERPLVIDQPEDQLDNRFLFETMLPALKRLKGRRQIIVATHSANIVVNGDADQVIQLEATSDRGQVACCGAIEEPAIRDAIVRTVDGGDEAFRLRRLKYGF